MRRTVIAAIAVSATLLFAQIAFSFSAPIANASQQRSAQQRQRDSTQVPTLASFRRLERRVQQLEKQVAALIGDALPPVVVPPPVVRPPTRPPVDPPPTRPPVTNSGRAPPVSITWKPRDQPARSFTFPEAEYSEMKRNGIGFRCYVSATPNADAWMITVAAINGYADRGVAYFEDLTIRVGGDELESITGRHVILPRGAILRRFFVGADADIARSWSWAKDDRPFPSWAPSRSRAELGNYAFEVGPYKFQWAYKNLDNSHGGHGVAPFHGGPDDWNTCAEGRRLREQEMLSAYQRPIWLLGPLPEEPYWMGRTKLHRLRGYNEDPDSWCDYAVKLNEVRAADYTHLSRTTGSAAALAKWDRFARDCLLNSFRDFKAANSLTRPKQSSQQLLWPLWAKVEAADGPLNSEGDRGLAHRLRLLRWMRPYVPADVLSPYEDAYRTWTAKLAGQYGYTRTSSPTVPAARPLAAPYIQSFHQQLNVYEFRMFGGLEDQAALLARHLTPDPPWYFEARDGGANDTVMDRNFKSPNGYPPYAGMTHEILLGFTNARAFVAAMEDRGVNGSSQDLDCTVRALWEPGL